MDYLETVQTHVDIMTLCRPKSNFDKITDFYDLDNFEISLQHRVASLYNQLHPEFQTINLKL